MTKSAVAYPSAPQAELAVLGCILTNSNLLSQTLALVSEDCFYNPKNKIIFNTIVSLYNNGYNIDLVTVIEELNKRKQLKEVGGHEYLNTIIDSGFIPSNIEDYCLILREKYIKRQLIQASYDTIAEASKDDTDAHNNVDNAESRIFSISEKRYVNNFVRISHIVPDTLKFIKANTSNDTRNSIFIKSGFYDLDDIICGFAKSDLIVIAARPSVGKTALCLSLINNICIENRIPTAFFSVEMSAVQITMRILSILSEINQHKIRSGNITEEEYQELVKATEKLNSAPLFIDDTYGLNVKELRAKCRRLKLEQNIQLVIVDYLQLLTGIRSDSREREIAYISQQLKQLAKEIDVPVITTAQLNRLVEARANKKPMLHDLRESGSIEQDADVVIMLYRPEIYGIQKFEDGSSSKHTVELLVCKQRNGATSSCKLGYIREITAFKELWYRDSFYGEMPEF